MPSGTVTLAGNEPVALAGALSHDQSAFSYQSISIVKCVRAMALLAVVCCRPRKTPSSIRVRGSRTKDMSSLAPGRWYMKRTYSPFSTSECGKSISALPSMSVALARLAWSTAPSWSRSVHRRWSWLTSVQL